MEQTLKKLLANDKCLIHEGTKELKQILSHPDCVGLLCNVLSTSQDYELRQYAAVILKRRFSKSANWNQLSNEAKSGIKTGLLQQLIAEPEKLVKNYIAQIISIILKHEMAAEVGWPDLVQFLHQSMTSQSMDDKELGFYSLSVLLETSPNEFLSDAKQFFTLFVETMKTLEDKSCPVAYFVVLCMIHFSSAVSGNKEITNKFVELLPFVLQTVQELATARPYRALDALDFFYEYSEKEEIRILLPHFKDIITLCLLIAEDQNKIEDLRIKSLSVISNFINVRVKTIVKLGLIPQILLVIFKLMCSKPEDDENEEYFTSDPDEDTLLTCACEVLDTIAMNMDAKKLIHPVMEFVKPAIEGTNPYEIKAGYLVLGIISQGCEAYIRYNCLDQFVKCVQGGVSHPHPVVRGAALFSIGQFAEHLQPEISVSANELMPILISQISELVERGKSGTRFSNRVDRLFYALDRFSENLESALAPYVHSLISQLLPLCKDPYHLHIRELAISTIGAIAGAVKEDIVPYFPEIMNHLNIYLMKQANDDDVSLQVEALDTLAMLARNVGEQIFQPLALDSINLGLSLVSSTDNPDIRKSSYGLFAAVSTVLKDSIGPLLPGIVEPIIKSIQDDGYIVHDDKKNSDFPLIEDSEDEKEDDESDDDMTIENDYIEEKEEACFALSELATHTGIAFFPYLQTSFEEVFKLLTFANSDVRRAALDAEFQFCISFAKVTESAENKDDTNLIQVTETLVAKTYEMIQIDDEIDVLLAGFHGFQNLLKEIGRRLQPSQSIKQNVVNSILLVLHGQLRVQQWEDCSVESNEVAELLDTAAYVLPSLMHITTEDEFFSIFSQIFPVIRKRIIENADDDDSDDGRKANALGVIAECMPGLSGKISEYLPVLLPFLMHSINDADPDVRNNALFTIGEMAYHVKDDIVPHYGAILRALSDVIGNEKISKVMDNACGVIARLILVSAKDLPLKQILPSYINQLPLKEDFEEDKWIFKSLCHLLKLEIEDMKPFVGDIFNAALVSLQSHHPDNETKEVIVSLIQMVNASFPDIVANIVQILGEDAVELLKKLPL
ncbi:importin-4-like [Cimex lectularius]|uniref:Importin N-terminal domain-containing protein n=1 Tax=Cimex lectularius TaxID=79782 RepID=A0A8I6SC25_CIMLE|nr:importin-4-like [Cimex lectularius]